VKVVRVAGRTYVCLPWPVRANAAAKGGWGGGWGLAIAAPRAVAGLVVNPAPAHFLFLLLR